MKDIFPNVTWALSILVTTAATCASVKWANSAFVVWWVERVLMLYWDKAYVHRDKFLDYDKIFGRYETKYPRRMLLINPLSET